MKETGKYSDFVRELDRHAATPVYFFGGSDDFLKREALKRLLDKVLPQEARPFNYETFMGSDCSWGDVETACLSAPLFSEKRLVALLGVEVMGEVDLSGLLSYARKPCDSTCLVVISSNQGEEPRRRGTVTVRRLAVGLEGLAASYVFWQNNRTDARVWAAGWLRDNKKRMHAAVLREVLETLDYSCYEIWNVLEKSAALSGIDEEITEAHVSQVGGAASVGSAKSFALAVAASDRECAHVHAARCLDAGVQPTALLWMLNRSFRAALRTSEGSRNERLNWRDQKVAVTLAGRFNEVEMCRAISFLYETERGIKTGAIEPRLALELLINELTR